MKGIFNTKNVQKRFKGKFISDEHYLNLEVSNFEKNNSINKTETSFNKFQKLGLHSKLCNVLTEDLKFKEPTKIQIETIPSIKKLKNVIASEKTGTGKTFAFLLPILNLFIENKIDKNSTSILILTPTKELGNQIFENLKQLTKDIKNYDQFTSILISGGNKSISKQIESFEKNNINCVISTPGRFLEILKKSKSIELDKIQHFIIDECDKMMGMGFLPDLIDIFDFINSNERNIQVCLFSATILPGIEGLMKKFVKNYRLINLNKNLSIANPIKHIQYRISLTRKKYQLLLYLLKRKSPFEKNSQILIFVRTKKRADRFSEFLKNDKFDSFSLHSEISSKKRLEIIENFKQNKFRILITTDVLSRGIDIPNLKYVINFDIPSSPEVYVHRIGRCGRMTNEGENTGFAISFVSETPQILNIGKRDVEINEVHYIKTIESFLQKRVELRKIPGPWKDSKNEEKKKEEAEIIEKSKERGIEILKRIKNEKEFQSNNSTFRELQNLAKKRRTDVKKLRYAPGLRNFKEGRYEDVIKEFERKSAEKRGLK
eukprot:gene1003-9909_t